MVRYLGGHKARPYVQFWEEENMTIMEAISRVDALKPNTYSARQKMLWLSQLEALVCNQVSREFSGFTEDTEPETVLLMEAPFDGAYLYWLEAQIHYANEDIGMYNNAIALFTDAYRAFLADYHRNHGTAGTGRFRF